MKTLKVTESIINELYENRKSKLPANIEGLEFEPAINKYFHLQADINSKQSAVVRYTGYDSISLVNPKICLEKVGLKPKDANQLALIDSLLNPEIPLVICNGPSGSGKTLLSVGYALQEILHSDKNKRLILIKPTETVKQSKFFGCMPGDALAKYSPFLDSFLIVIKKLFPDKDYISLLQQNGKIEFKPIEFIRGDSYESCLIVADEFQNASYHSTKTLVTRVGEGSKLILLGDTTQKDINEDSKCGFERMLTSVSFAESNLTSHITLKANYRSAISKLMGSIDRDLGY